MRWNDIGDDGILLVVDGLRCNNALTKLDVAECGISVKGAVVSSCTVKFGQTRL